MADAIATLNAGSSSLKFQLFGLRGEDLAPGVRGQVERLGTAPRFVASHPDGRAVGERTWSGADASSLGFEGALDHILEFLQGTLGGDRLVGVGHRVVHGGTARAAPARVDAGLLAELEALVPLAPLHQPNSLVPMRRLLARAPRLPQVACFDTAFHRSMPELAQRFAIPSALHDQGIRRYGFHGLSYEYVASALPALDPRAAAGRTVVLHLGNGASMCALAGGRSVATTMGFTPLDGLVMGTRCGALDPGVVLHLVSQGRDADAVARLLYYESGLLGVSGRSGDLRVLLAADDAPARLAVDLYVYRIGRELGSLAAALGGLDALVFTAGVGENSAELRGRICRGAAWLGVELDEAANARGGPRVSGPASRVAAWVLPTDEERMIARHTRRLLAGPPAA